MDCGPKPLNPEIVPAPTPATNPVTDGDPDSDGNQMTLK